MTDLDHISAMQSGTGDTKNFFAGADDKRATNAKFYVTAEGAIFHSSIGDAYTKARQANFGTGNDLQPFGNWQENVAINYPDPPDENSNNKIEYWYVHRAGINRLVVSGSKTYSPSSGPDVQSVHDAWVELELNDGSTDHTAEAPLTGPGSTFGTTLDISELGLVGGTAYRIRIRLHVYVEIQGIIGGGSEGSATTIATINENTRVQHLT